MGKLNFFDAGSPFLQHPLLTAVRTAQEIDFILNELNLAPGARVLDVGCGFGRHSIALAKRGFDVLGIDPAAAMIAAARERATETAVSVQFQQAHAETFTAQHKFDAAICLFTTLGQISEAGENSQLVTRVFDALKPGGCFVMEVPQRETAVAQLKLSEQFGAGERYTAVTRQFDPQNNTVTEQFKLVAPEGNRVYLLRYRLFEKDELTNMLTSVGFSIRALYGGYEALSLQNDSPVMVVIAEK